MARTGRKNTFSEPLSKQVLFLLTETQYEKVKENAWQAKMSVAEYIRRKLGFFKDEE